MRAVTLAAIASMGMIGCVGGLTDMGPPNPPPAGSDSGSDAARIDFNEHVYPSLTAHCGGCHGQGGTATPAFVSNVDPNTSSDETTAWNTVNTAGSVVIGTYTSSAPILLYGATSGAHPTGGAPNGLYSSTEQTVITNWLGLEAAWRNASSTGSGSGSGSGSSTALKTADQLLAIWSGCMTETDFKATYPDGNGNNTTVYDAWGNMQTGEGACNQCHVNGTNNFEASNQEGVMWEYFPANKAVMMQYFSVDITNQVVKVNSTNFTPQLMGYVPWSSHPRLNNKGDLTAAMTVLTNYATAVQAHITAGNCAAPNPNF